MAKSKTKTPGANLPVPQSREEAVSTLTEIGTLYREFVRLEVAMNDELSAIKEAHERIAVPLQQQIGEKTEGLKIWAEANRAALTGGKDVKTVDMGTGKLMWRKRPPAVRLKKVEEILDRLKKLGLHRFIRTKEEVDKEAMQREPDVAREVPGVSIGSAGEEFIVEPYEAALSPATP